VGCEALRGANKKFVTIRAIRGQLKPPLSPAKANPRNNNPKKIRVNQRATQSPKISENPFPNTNPTRQRTILDPSPPEADQDDNSFCTIILSYKKEQTRKQPSPY